MTNQIDQPNPSIDPAAEYRKLPAVDALLREAALAWLVTQYGQDAVTAAIRDALDDARRAIAGGGSAPPEDEWPALIDARLSAAFQPSIRPVINATGVIVHTNLGRAPLSTVARTAVDAISQGYSNLEYELDAGRRGSRHDHARELLRALSGAEDAMVVNNNAAAVYLVLTAFCQEREVLISRGQLVEIGGGFRIPDVLRQSGAKLVEVGATNRTHLRDFSGAITPATRAIMRVHSSNFRQIGFVTQPALADLVTLAHGAKRDKGDNVLLLDDLGSGSFLETAAYGLTPEPTVQESLAAGADLVTFSGDKLLGGPQAGLIVGRAELIERLRRHPMARAIRVGKMTLAALEATLQAYRRARATEEIPVWRMISASADVLRTRVEGWLDALAEAGVHGQAIPGESAVGGGSLPGETLPTWLLALETDAPDAAAGRLRAGSTPVICRIQQDRLLFDPRTVLPEQDGALVRILSELIKIDD
jgi:L-seryl-tRNA(Ser) seleniumtransferase